jgi:hypothetical protein
VFLSTTGFDNQRSHSAAQPCGELMDPIHMSKGAGTLAGAATEVAVPAGIRQFAPRSTPFSYCEAFVRDLLAYANPIPLEPH